MRVLICGDRNWSDFEAVRRVVSTLPAGTVVIEGEARGADSMARIAAYEAGLDVLRFPAKWDELGRRAGPLRNIQMLQEGAPTHVIYFHADLDSSKGTKHMVGIARKAGLPVCAGHEWEVGA